MTDINRALSCKLSDLLTNNEYIDQAMADELIGEAEDLEDNYYEILKAYTDLTERTKKNAI